MFKLICFASFWILGSCLHPDAGLSIVELATKYDYPIETHKVTTADGYVLTLHRIPGLNGTTGIKHPVLLMHGLLSSSVDWINLGPKRSLGLLLADKGYDVWLGNQRGNTWSRKHITIDPAVDPEKFFDFSFHEVGVYDLPAIIDHILGVVKTEKLFYIGHSQGTTDFFVMASEKPEYNDKIKLMVALAPVAYVGNLPNPFLTPLVDGYDLIMSLNKILEIYEVLPHSHYFTEIGNTLCGEGSQYQDSCVWFLNIIAGFDWQIEPNFIPVITSNAPAGCSIKNLLHYVQEMDNGNFAQYDYGTENRAKYGQDTPPRYDLSKITAPVSLYYASNDWLSAVEDVLRLAEELPNTTNVKRVPFLQFNHLDFLWARNAADLLYANVINDLNVAGS